MQNLGVLDRFKKTRERAIEKVLDSDLAKSQSEALSRIIGRNSGTGPHTQIGADVVLTEADSHLNVDSVKRMLKWLAEAVGRSLELSPSSDTSVYLSVPTYRTNCCVDQRMYSQ